MLRFRSLCARRWLRDEVEKGAMPVWQTLTRRELFRGLSVLALAAGRAESAQPSNFFPPLQAGSAADEAKLWKGSALGNLYPFIKGKHDQKPAFGPGNVEQSAHRWSETGEILLHHVDLECCHGQEEARQNDFGRCWSLQIGG